MNRLLAVLSLFLATSAPWLKAQTVSAALPTQINDTLTSGQLALLASATSGGACVSSANVHCATTSFSDLVSGCAATGPLSAALSGLGASDQVIVIPAGSTAVGPVCSAPFAARAPGCIGNNVIGGDEQVSSFLMPITDTFQANPSSPHKIFIISSHHASIPPQYTRLIVSTGNGYSPAGPYGQIKNANLSDLYKITTNASGNGAICFPDGASNYVIMDMEIANASTIAAYQSSAGRMGPGGDVGYASFLAFTKGTDSSSRAIAIAFPNGTSTLYKDMSLLIASLPVISKCHVGTPTGPDCSDGVPINTSLLYFDGIFTNFVQGRSSLRIAWGGYPMQGGSPDTVVNALTQGGGAGQCPAAAVSAGNDVVGNVCVTDATHAWASVSYTPTSPWNGGIHTYQIDTVPLQTISTAATPCVNSANAYWNGVGSPGIGGEWCGGTEHAITTGILEYAFNDTSLPITEPWSITSCTGCWTGQPGPNGETRYIIPNDNLTHAITIQSARGQFSSTAVLVPTGRGSDYLLSGTPVVNTGPPQTITGYSLKSPGGGSLTTGFFATHSMILKTVSNFSTGPLITPNSEIDPIFMNIVPSGGSTTVNEAVDFVGPTRRAMNWVVPGNQYTVDVWGVQTAWTGMNCSSNCAWGQSGNPTYVNFGSDIAVDSFTSLASNHIQVTFTVCDGVTTNAHNGCRVNIAAEQGANNVWWMHDYVHGYDGLFLHTGPSYSGNTDTAPMPANITAVNTTTSPATFTAGNTYTAGQLITLYGFQSSPVDLSFLNGQQVTVSSPTSTSFRATVSGPSVTASGQTATITAWNCTQSFMICTFTTNPMSTPYSSFEVVTLSGFTTTTQFNGISMVVQNGATTTTFSGHVGGLNGSGTETGTATGLGAAQIPCTGAVHFYPNQVCFLYLCLGTQHLMVLDGPGTVVQDSYLSEAHANQGGDVQGISINANPGPFKLHNTYVNATTEGVLFGGSGNNLTWAPTNTRNIEIFNNLMWKTPIWMNYGISWTRPGLPACYDTTPKDGRFACALEAKDTMELKGGTFSHIYNNIFDGHTPQVSGAYPMLIFTPRTCQGQGTYGAYIDDVTVENNILINLRNGSQIAAADDHCFYSATPNGGDWGDAPVLEGRRYVFGNNLWLMNQNENSAPVHAAFGEYIYFNSHDVKFDHQTHTVMGSLPTAAQQLNYINQGNDATPPTIHQQFYNTWITNDVLYHGIISGNNVNGITLTQQDGGPTGTGIDRISRYTGNVWCSGSNVSTCTPTTNNDVGVPVTDPGNGKYSTITSNATFNSPIPYTCQDAMNPLSTFYAGPSPANSCFTFSGGHWVLNGNYQLNGAVSGTTAVTNWINGTRTTDGASSGINQSGLSSAVLPGALIGTEPSGTSSPVVTPQTIGNGAVGESDSIQMAGTGGVQCTPNPYQNWTVSSGSLPPGYSLNSSTGLISATGSSVTTSGTYNFSLTMQDCTVPTPQTSAPQGFTIVINPRLTIGTGALPSATTGVAYAASLTATGGLSPYVYGVASGTMSVCPTLTNGLCLNSGNGGITGTPTSATTMNFTGQVTDPGISDCTGSNSVACANFSIVVVPTPIYVSPTSLPGGNQYVAYPNINVVVTSGTPPYTYTLLAGAWPTGITLNSSTGLISGTPTQSGSFSVNIHVADSGGQSVNSGNLSFTITAAPTLTVLTSGLPNGTQGTAYGPVTLSASGGTGTGYTWSVIAGAFPSGVGLSGTGNGTVSGTPTVSGSFSVTLQVQDSAANTASSGALPFTIQASAPALVVNTTSLPNGMQNTPYSATLSASGGVPPYTWSLDSGSFPTGVTLATNGLISGTPSTFGSFTVTVRVTDSVLTTATSNPLGFTITQQIPALAVTTTTMNGGVRGVAYSSPLVATGGVPPYTWTVVSGALPPGLSVTGAGVLWFVSGTPSQSGLFTFTPQVTDSNTPPSSATSSSPLTITIQPPPPILQISGTATLHGKAKAY